MDVRHRTHHLLPIPLNLFLTLATSPPTPCGSSPFAPNDTTENDLLSARSRPPSVLEPARPALACPSASSSSSELDARLSGTDDSELDVCASGVRRGDPEPSLLWLPPCGCATAFMFGLDLDAAPRDPRCRLLRIFCALDVLSPGFAPDLDELVRGRDMAADTQEGIELADVVLSLPGDGDGDGDAWRPGEGGRFPSASMRAAAVPNDSLSWRTCSGVCGIGVCGARSETSSSEDTSASRRSTAYAGTPGSSASIWERRSVRERGEPGRRMSAKPSCHGLEGESEVGGGRGTKREEGLGGVRGERGLASEPLEGVGGGGVLGDRDGEAGAGLAGAVPGSSRRESEGLRGRAGGRAILSWKANVHADWRRRRERTRCIVLRRWAAATTCWPGASREASGTRVPVCSKNRARFAFALLRDDIREGSTPAAGSASWPVSHKVARDASRTRSLPVISASRLSTSHRSRSMASNSMGSTFARSARHSHSLAACSFASRACVLSIAVARSKRTRSGWQ
ncbi:hypothetical protein DAEQUDRAFT_422104 [Daedalea quercina L-15889]|uniref:Uncharacterized protein n=1 Tax=Daedalea quercina L-15889 TaxID=1314783 RepID=A0A165TLZ6_9APHY|nr:hypothetical protein DAEQUDRAFT_422104 [Daedalea quercina L-15889]